MIGNYQREMISWNNVRHLPLVLVVEQGTHKPLVAILSRSDRPAARNFAPEWGQRPLKGISQAG